MLLEYTRDLVRRAAGAAGLLAGLLAVAVGVAAAPEAVREVRVRLDAATVVWRPDSEPLLEVEPLPGDGWYRLARRYCEDPGAARRIDRANPRQRAPQRGRRVVIPLTLLGDELRLEAIRRLFPADRRVGRGWEHWVLDPFGGGEEDWSFLSALFTGQRSRAEELRHANPGLAGSGPVRGRTVLIPEWLLAPAFARLKPAPTPAPGSVSSDPVGGVPTSLTADPVDRSGVGRELLRYGEDARGQYAVYELRRGEALYSSVVVRYTGQLHAAEVNATAQLIARRSGIRDVTDIPVGYPVKIPLGLLLPEYLPAGHPKRVEWEREQRELGRVARRVPAAGLAGVHVILDAGHGGNDSGAVQNGVWESTYTYDMVCRVKEKLEEETRATVWPMVLDLGRGYQIPNRDRLAHDRDQVLLTHPRYGLESSVLGVHLRWYLANDIVRQRLAAGVDPSKIVFLSIHIDSLHPSVRGAMAYVPSRHHRPESYRAGTSGLGDFREYRRQPRVRLTGEFVKVAEASSRRLARSIISVLEEGDLEVHPYKPIRGSILRGRRRWVPAVLRFSLAETAVLLECANLANDDDRQALLDVTWRDRLADAIVEGLSRAFDGRSED